MCSNYLDKATTRCLRIRFEGLESIYFILGNRALLVFRSIKANMMRGPQLDSSLSIHCDGSLHGYEMMIGKMPSKAMALLRISNVLSLRGENSPQSSTKPRFYAISCARSRMMPLLAACETVAYGMIAPAALPATRLFVCLPP